MGDPNQLPATVLSSAALEHGYNTSMFERLQAAGHPVQVTQHVKISVITIDYILFVHFCIHLSACSLSVVKAMPRMCAA